MLALLVLTVGGVLLYRELRGFGAVVEVDTATISGRIAILLLGFGVGVPSGLFGVGGPVFAVPVLVLVGVPILVAVAAAQVQSVFITGGAAGGYLVRGTIDPVLLGAIAPSLLLGVGVGWRVAHRIDASHLQRVLAFVPIGLGLHLASDLY